MSLILQVAKKYHPDTNKDPKANDKFLEAQQAYELLSDAEKRQQYDQFGGAAFGADGSFSPGGAGGFGGGGFSGFGGATSGGFGFGGINLDDLFKGAFGGGGAGPGGRTGGRSGVREVLIGGNIETTVNISFLEAARGIQRTVPITSYVPCGTCSGSGVKAGGKAVTCSQCGGTGSAVRVQAGFMMQFTCPTCEGEGTYLPRDQQCSTCSGQGAVRQRRTVTVDVPAGIEDGMKLRMPNEGDMPRYRGDPSGVEKRRGDLFANVRVAPHEYFRRNGPNLTYTASIPFTTAVLGGVITVPTLDESVGLRVPQGTATGERVQIQNRGMPRLRSGGKSRGDLSVEFKVQIPM